MQRWHLHQPEPGRIRPNLVAKYAVKHNPFIYFANVQGNTDPDNGFNNMADFTG